MDNGHEQSEQRTAFGGERPRTTVQGTGHAGDTLDWRSRFDKNPWLVLGVAFSGGVALALLASSNHRANGVSELHEEEHKPASRLGQEWHKVQGALLTLAANRAEQFLDEVLPGFRAAYHSQR